MSVNTYSKNSQGGTKLSAHFAVREFACQDGTDTILIDADLIDKLEQIYANLNCSKVIINSGYRTPAHDKAVGGNGSGQHTLGKAADIQCYDKSGNLINAKQVCCTAESLGCHGIGYISAKAVHIDTRSGKWWGDETTGNDNISSFYSYFGIAKPNSNPYTEPSYNISRNATGEGVKWVQWALTNKGYSVGNSGIDGVCGNDTLSAIKRFQGDNGLTVDGIVGKNTRAKLKA